MSLAREAAAAIPVYPEGGGTDHKAWAKRILWREARGDKTLLAIQVRFAREAMEVKQEAA